MNKPDASPEGAAMEARLIHDRDKDRVEKIAGLLEEIATLRAELERVREQWADTEIARWTAVQELSRERERHQEALEALNFSVTDVYSEDIIWRGVVKACAILEAKAEPAPVDTGGNQ